jgi:FADH2 O2-dependent halogenase
LLERLLGIESSSDGFLTNSFAIFSHFNHVPKWAHLLQKDGIPSDDFPYNPDNSALHHILDEGWLWMLRFNDERTSLGFVLNNSNSVYGNLPTEKIWDDMLKKYPSINNIIKDASLASQPGKIIHSERLQRKIKHCFGPGWVALPHTAGFVDPLFSSGIAHSLSGIEKIINAISQNWGNEEFLQQNLEEYEKAVFEELKLSDYLVAGCYKTMDHFELFNAWSMLYFASMIAHEQRRIKHESPGYFLNADDPAIRNMVQKSYADLLNLISNQQPTRQDIKWFISLVKEKIQPFNTAGLMEPSSKNMYHHTAAMI